MVLQVIRHTGNIISSVQHIKQITRSEVFGNLITASRYARWLLRRHLLICTLVSNCLVLELGTICHHSEIQIARVVWTGAYALLRGPDRQEKA